MNFQPPFWRRVYSGRVCTGHENPESHGIYDFNFQAWKVMEFLVKAMESHGKAICVKKIKRQKDKKFGKITDELK